MSESNQTRFDIPLSVRPPPLAVDQAILIQDDCKTKAVAVLPGLNGLSPGRFIASLHLSSGTDASSSDADVLADSITNGVGQASLIGSTKETVTQGSASNLLVIGFPSLGPLLRAKGYSGACGRGFSAPGAAAMQLKNAALWLQEVSDSRWRDLSKPKKEDSCETKKNDLCEPNKNKSKCVAPSLDKADSDVGDQCFPFKIIFYEKLQPQPDISKQPAKPTQPTTFILPSASSIIMSPAPSQ